MFSSSFFNIIQKTYKGYLFMSIYNRYDDDDDDDGEIYNIIHIKIAVSLSTYIFTYEFIRFFFCIF
jgi:hypothetical protein